MSLIVVQILLLALSAGALSGLTGVGGGVIFTPLFKMICESGDFPSSAVDSVRLSMLAVLMTNAPSLFVPSKYKHIKWSIVFPYVLPMVLGVTLSQFVVVQISSFLHDLLLFCLILHLIVLSYIPALNPFFFVSSPILIGFLVGLTSGIAGIGGSFLLFPLWRRLSLTFHQIQANNTLFAVISSLSLSIFAYLTGWQPPLDLLILGLIIFLAGLSNMIFASLSSFFSEQFLKRLYTVFFSVLLLFYALRILIHVYS